MEYIIDAYNLIKSSFLGEYEQKESMDRARDCLFGILLEYRKKHPSVMFTAVFDGFPPSPELFLREKNIRMLFSFDTSADEIIRQLLEKRAGGNMSRTVVSNDRGVRDCGKLFGSGVLSVAGFLEIILPAQKKKAGARTGGKNIEDINRMSIEKELKAYYKKRTEGK